MKWGFLAYGTIAPKFFQSLQSIADQEVVAIASKSQFKKAKKDHPSARIYTDYIDFYNDPEIEIVYLSSTHNNHYSQAVKVLESGKHLICEKPLTTSEQDTRSLVQVARVNNVFLMEGIWTRCMPAYREVLNLTHNGTIGAIKYIESHFSFYNDWGPERRLFNKDLAGGATYDVGIYNLSLIFDILGNHPSQIKAMAEMTREGVDQACTTLLGYKSGAMAVSHCGFQLDTDHRATIYGTEGWIEMELHWKVQRFTICQKGKETKQIEIPFQSNGYVHEIIEALECIDRGSLESLHISHNTSISLARTMDIILNQIGYK